MNRKKVLVLGGNFGGLTAALAVSRELHGDVDIRVISASDRFVFNPSLTSLPFGKRRPADITFPLAPVFETHGIDFVPAEAIGIDPGRRRSPDHRRLRLRLPWSSRPVTAITSASCQG